MPLWKWKEVQEVPRRRSLTAPLWLAVVLAMQAHAQSSNDAIWHEFGLAQQSSAKIGKTTATIYRMNDVTGAVAAWEWRRQASSHACTTEPFCSADGNTITVVSANYVVTVNGAVKKADLDTFLTALPNRHDTSLPPILNYTPRQNLVPNSARYVLGPESLRVFASPLGNLKPGFDQGAEAEIADYKISDGPPLHLALFYYPTPEMARIHTAQFRQVQGLNVKRSSVLVAIVFGGATDQQATALLNRIQYEANITWNEIPPPSPIKPLFLLIRNIIYLSVVLSALCFVAGLIYAGLRLYRRRFGSLEEDEAMTTLHLSRD